MIKLITDQSTRARISFLLIWLFFVCFFSGLKRNAIAHEPSIGDVISVQNNQSYHYGKWFNQEGWYYVYKKSGSIQYINRCKENGISEDQCYWVDYGDYSGATILHYHAGIVDSRYKPGNSNYIFYPTWKIIGRPALPPSDCTDSKCQEQQFGEPPEKCNN